MGIGADFAQKCDIEKRKPFGPSLYRRLMKPSFAFGRSNWNLRTGNNTEQKIKNPHKADFYNCLNLLVGARGFEPPLR